MSSRTSGIQSMKLFQSRERETSGIKRRIGFRAASLVLLAIGLSSLTAQLQPTVNGSDHVENSSMLNGRGGPSWRNDTATVPQAGVLEAEFRINGGAASTLERIVTLNFQVRRRIGQETRSTVATHYRAVESPNLLNADLSGQPWIALRGQIKASLTLQLGNGQGQRYGDRLVMFQVRDELFSSSVLSDTILLQPTLKDYSVTGTLSGVLDLFRYANQMGFQSQVVANRRCRKCQTCSNCTNVEHLMPSFNPDGTTNFQMQAQQIQNARCVTESIVRVFVGRTLNSFWRIKSIQGTYQNMTSYGTAGDTGTLSNAIVTQTYERFGANESNAFQGTLRVDREGVAERNLEVPDDCKTLLNFTITKIVLEGPDKDVFTDPQNPWKNAFVRPQ